MSKTEYIKCYLSERGHNNFFYPSSVAALITAGCEYDVLSWVGGSQDLKPVKLLKSCVLPLAFNGAVTSGEFAKSSRSYTVVWIHR